ncbi:hypothetical protein A2165_01930 [Candidatus Curtissbacteria bacterium RBG_13_40_7]|uniref:Glycosyltransferase RgtA/B/C/D-like domain-containing protein n=1 Tax=Candidatus Curtissbacteria bacterium RBG_13_40_7 TaxID=1797706 RepID=A0A1F5FU30_9BACT|nr:MAG: hypothetical protein A2165_01930 [Candidatus Curtissbacteria bacterium RBG_13_40_7]
MFSQEAARCYFNALNPNFIYKTVGLIGLVSLLYFLYKIITGKRFVLTGILLFLPIFPFLGFSPIIVVYPYKVFAIIGLIVFLYKKSE